MELRANERSPGRLEDRAPISTAREPDQGRQRLRDAFQPQLDLPVPAFERRARAVHALQRPCVTVRPAQLTLDGCRRRALGGLKELVESRDAERACGLEVGGQVAGSGEARLGSGTI